MSRLLGRKMGQKTINGTIIGSGDFTDILLEPQVTLYYSTFIGKEKEF